MYKFDPEQITFFAKTDARGQEVPFGIKAKDRTRHVYVIGKTGMGKSTLLENMAVQDIKNGNGLAFIDPHGQTAETLLGYIPEERIDDVMYFAPFDTDYPVSFNVLEDVGPDKRHLVVSGLMSVFKKIWVDAWSARMEYILSNTLLALLEYPDSTLLGVNRMLSDKVYRRKVIDNISDPAVKSFWVDEFLNYNERYMQEAGDSIKNKIGQFTANPLIRNIVGQSHTSFDIRKMMDERKILIMNLSKGLVGESNANLLGSMLTTRIYLAAMSRADLTQEEMKDKPNFYFYVDEFQSFANATFADILSEARKYKLNLTIAHQYVAQMEEEVRDAVFGNVGTTISFRVGPFDAEVLESIFTPKFLAPDIVNLGFAQIYLTLMIDGIGSQPFSAVTLPPIELPEATHRDVVIANSRKLYAHPRAGVEAMINAWHESEGSSSKNNDKKKDDRPAAAGKSGGSDKPRRDNNRKDNSPAYKKKTDEPKGEKKASEGRSEKSNDRPEKKNEKNLDELRAILRGIAGVNPDDTKASEATKPKVKEGEEGVKPVAATKRPDDTASESPRQSSRPNKEREPQKSERKVSETKPRAATNTSLQSALAAALSSVDAQPAGTPKVTSKPERTDSKPKNEADEPAPASKPVQPEAKPQAAPAPTPAPTPQQSPAAPTKDNASTDDPLSPKKLERMMRVTGSDKTPFS